MVRLLISAWPLPGGNKVRKIDGRCCTLRKSWPLAYWQNSSVVGDDSVGDLEATCYVLPAELDNLLPADLGERHCLDLFGEVVSGYQ